MRTKLRECTYFNSLLRLNVRKNSDVGPLSHNKFIWMADDTTPFCRPTVPYPWLYPGSYHYKATFFVHEIG